MRLTVLFLCIASLTFALALPAWKQVTKIPRSLSSSLRVGASEVQNFGKQALLRGGARFSRRDDQYYDPMCEDAFAVLAGFSAEDCFGATDAKPGSPRPKSIGEVAKNWWQGFTTYVDGWTSNFDGSRPTVISPENQSNFNVYVPSSYFPSNSPT
ncbi:hypothetical protein MMC07_006668 [Pseudocyphellaria aurata]|nr:hypothetical protein [Pseudocyphellaria aurata]